MTTLAPLAASLNQPERAWVNEAVLRLEQEAIRSADTHLHRIDLPGFPEIQFYLKDESAHPTGSLKHRLARSLFLYALCNGRLKPEQTVVDTSSGSTAISEAWFARLLGIPFVAILPANTAPGKIREIKALGAECEYFDAGTSARDVAKQYVKRGCCFLDQFGLAEQATDWRGNNNIAESTVAQLAREPHPEPEWFVCGAGTGGTSATIGRFLRYRRMQTRLCVAEPSGCAYARGWASGGTPVPRGAASLIEGIGRESVEPSFVFEVADRVVEVEDSASIAAALLLEKLTGRRYGGSSGTNFFTCLQLAAEMKTQGRRGSIVSLLCDRGERYAETIYCPEWRDTHGIVLDPWLSCLEETMASGELHEQVV